jgi:hypothetical protein
VTKIVVERRAEDEQAQRFAEVLTGETELEHAMRKALTSNDAFLAAVQAAMESGSAPLMQAISKAAQK